MKVDFTTDPATTTTYGLSGSGVPTFELFSAWGDTNNIYLVQRGQSTGVAKLWKFVKSSGTVSELSSSFTGTANFVTVLNGYAYVGYQGGVGKVDVSTGATTAISTTPSNQMSGIMHDGTLVFATELEGGKIWEINPSTNTATLRVSGLNRPLGIYVTATDIYVAENVAGGGAKKISRSTWTVTNTATLGGSTRPYGVIVVGSVAVISSAANADTNVYLRRASDLTTTGLSTTSLNSGKVTLMLQSDGSSVFVGFMGSAGIIKIDGVTGQLSYTGDTPEYFLVRNSLGENVASSLSYVDAYDIANQVSGRQIYGYFGVNDIRLITTTTSSTSSSSGTTTVTSVSTTTVTRTVTQSATTVTVTVTTTVTSSGSTTTTSTTTTSSGNLLSYYVIAVESSTGKCHPIAGSLVLLSDAQEIANNNSQYSSAIWAEYDSSTNRYRYVSGSRTCG